MIPLLSIMTAVVALDQVTKVLLTAYIPLHTGKVIIPGFFNLIHVRNTGGAFSILAGASSSWRLTFFVCLTLALLAVLIYAYSRVKPDDRWTRTAYALICGGAAGNLVDRLRLGEVIDFLDFHVGTYHWPAFNVADSAISTGAVMLLISLLRGK